MIFTGKKQCRYTDIIIENNQKQKNSLKTYSEQAQAI